MSRFVKRSEKEPLLRLERPTVASSQTTAHIINSCFNEVLSQRQQIDSGAINNMAVSRRGDPNLYHDSFVDEAKQISDHYQRRLDDLLNVERHLLQAKAKALAEDERNLSQSATDLTGQLDVVVLPNGPSQFRKQLNEELLSRHCLLSPNQYLPQPLAPRGPPKEGPPSYLQSTYTWKQHALVPDGMDKQSSFSPRKKKQPLKPIWKDALSQEEREAEKNRLAKLERKAGYLKNPKSSQTALNNTASSGPLKLKLQQQLDSDGLCKDSFQMFVAEPSELVFTDYQVNKTYEATVMLKNVSGASRQLRVIPLSSPFFKVHTGYFPSSEGLIAPGMYCSYVVKFTPDSLTDYEEQLSVQCNNGEILTVSLRAFRPPPDLSLPRDLDCGHCLAGDSKTVVMKCDNFGGEGSFKLISNEEDSDNKNEEKEISDSLRLGPFTFSPTEFSLAKGGSIEFTAVFSPPAVGWYSEQFTMACDNGQMLTFSLVGGADLITVGALYCGHSSPQEITTYHAYAKSNDVSNGELPGDLSDSFVSKDQEVVVEKLEWPTVEVVPTYPCRPAYSTVTIHNFSGVDLPFCWQFYRPIGFAQQSNEDVPVNKQLVPTSERLFSVQPSSGILRARESMNFFYEFSPQSVGEFVDVAHLVLSGIHTDLSLDPSKAASEWLRLSDDQVSISHIELNGICEPYSIELEPSAIVLHEEIPCAVEVRRPFQMTNKSLSDVSYEWNCSKKEGLSVSVEPASGLLNAGDCVSSEVVLQAKKVGPFSVNLHCLLEHSRESLSLMLEGCVQAPVVKLSVVSLDFGLIQFGRSASLKFDIINESYCPMSFQLQQVVKEKKKFTDHSCLSFSPSSEGELEPLSTTTVTVECQPCQTGQLRSLVQFMVNNEHSRFVAVIADVQRPKVHLETSEFHFKDAFVEIENHLTTELVNTGLLPCYYSWSSQVYGDDDRHCSVAIHPMTGKVDPGQSATVSVTSTWNKEGSHQARLKCDVINVESPLFLDLTSQVHNLAVTYKIINPASKDDVNINRESESESSNHDELLLDYGDCNVLGEPKALELEISNPTAISTSYDVCVSSFPAAKPPTPPAQPMPGANMLKSRGRYLLNRTLNTADPRSKSHQQAALDYASALLHDGRGACFAVSPCCGPLTSYSTVRVKVTAYSNMWGEYSDQLICKVTGLESKVLPIKYGIKGCPIVFQTTATSGYTLCRLGSHLPDAKTVVRVLKLRNTSPVALRVDWRMMNLLQDDNKIIDLVTFIGEPFPKTDFLMDSGSDDIILQTDHFDVSTNDINEPIDANIDSVEETDSEEQGASSFEQLVVTDCQQLIGALIKPHEGVFSNDPFDIHPKQMTIPPHGHGALQVSFQPSIKALNDLGDHLASYAVGYISLDEESPVNVKRLSGYDVEPLRIDILAAIEHPKLTLECDEDSGLAFNCSACMLLDDNSQLKKMAFLSHHMTLVNHTLSTTSIKLSVEEKHFRISGLQCANRGEMDFTTLHPGDSLHFNVVFSFSRNDVRKKELLPDSRSLHYSTSLCVEFSTGAKQVFPVAATITLPGISISPQQLNFGKCHLGNNVNQSLLLLNSNPVAALWSVKVLEPEIVLQVSDECGLLPAHLIEGGPTSQLIQVSFTPSMEKEYTGKLIINELITGSDLCIRVSGEGTADEKYLR